MFLLTVYHVLAEPAGLPIGLLGQYFYGYDVTWAGAVFGAAWAGGVGFFSGWLLGFTHNRVMLVWLLLVRIKTDLSQRRNLFDHLR